VAVDPIPRFDPVERRLVLARHRAADADGVLMDAVVEIVPHRRGELRLGARLFEDFRINLGDVAEGAIECRAGNAALRRGAAEALDPALEAGIGQGRGRRKQQTERDGGGRGSEPRCAP
jgi:hypothetical protein